jgi:hypothetical protein
VLTWIPAREQRQDDDESRQETEQGVKHEEVNLTPAFMD